MDTKRIQELIAEALDIELDEVRPDSSSETLEAWDSLGHLRVILAVEAAFLVRFPTKDIPNLTSVQALVDGVARQKSAA